MVIPRPSKPEKYVRPLCLTKYEIWFDSITRLQFK
ncbi:hypothetical protein [Escherichia phage pEC-M2929-1AR.1]|nr:hypothetical protein [Escherichia phage pEC-M2929-1AR.1]